MEKKKRRFDRTSCPICLEENNVREMVKKFKCNHYICSQCFGKHLGSKCSSVCPICRSLVDINFLNKKELEIYNNRPSYLEDNDINPFELLSNLIDDDSNDSSSLIWYGNNEDSSTLSKAFGFTKEVNINDLRDGISRILPSR